MLGVATVGLIALAWIGLWTVGGVWGFLYDRRVQERRRLQDNIRRLERELDFPEELRWGNLL